MDDPRRNRRVERVVFQTLMEVGHGQEESEEGEEDRQEEKEESGQEVRCEVHEKVRQEDGIQEEAGEKEGGKEEEPRGCSSEIRGEPGSRVERDGRSRPLHRGNAWGEDRPQSGRGLAVSDWVQTLVDAE